MPGAAPTSVQTSTPVRQPSARRRRPWWLFVLAIYSLLLGLITEIPQFYYVLYALGLVTIGPHSNALGQVWYWYNFNGDNSYIKIDPGLLAGAVEDAFLLAPLYLATGIGLLSLRRWVVPLGLMTGAMIFYGTLQLYVGDAFAHYSSITNEFTYWITLLPYMVYPLWLIPALLTRRALFEVPQLADTTGSRIAD